MKILQRLLTDAPLISGNALAAMISIGRSREFEAAEHPYDRKVREIVRPQMTSLDNGIVEIPVEGVLARKPDVMELLYYGFEDTTAIHGMIESAAYNQQVSGILLNIDSIGGFLTGGPETADAVRAALKLKPVVTWTGGTMASMAYWIGSQSGMVVSSRFAQIGSIGVYSAHIDYTKVYEELGVKIDVIKNAEAEHKAAGLYGTALTEPQRAEIQARIQTAFREFRKAVTSARPGVTDEVMRGQVLSGFEAKPVGLVDRIGDKSFAVGLLRQEIRKRGVKN